MFALLMEGTYLQPKNNVECFNERIQPLPLVSMKDPPGDHKSGKYVLQYSEKLRPTPTYRFTVVSE